MSATPRHRGDPRRSRRDILPSLPPSVTIDAIQRWHGKSTSPTVNELCHHLRYRWGRGYYIVRSELLRQIRWCQRKGWLVLDPDTERVTIAPGSTFVPDLSHLTQDTGRATHDVVIGFAQRYRVAHPESVKVRR